MDVVTIGAGAPMRPDSAGQRVVAAAVGGDGAPGAPSDLVITGEDWLDAICPFLRARDGSWRSASPAREHRCWALEPPAELAVLTQQRLCLVRAHDGCERFRHARELRAAVLARERAGPKDAPPVAATAPARRRRRASAADRVRDIAADVLRAPWFPFVAVACGVVVLMMVGVLVLGSRGGPERPSSPVPVRPSASVAVPDPGTPGPDGMRRYRVRADDTLRTIADRFGVSVRQLRQVNDLGDPPRLEVGEVILIPPGS